MMTLNCDTETVCSTHEHERRTDGESFFLHEETLQVLSSHRPALTDSRNSTGPPLLADHPMFWIFRDITVRG